MIKKILLSVFVLSGYISNTSSQTVLTLEKALEFAAENSPSVIASRLNLEDRQSAMDAERARLKSKFSLSLNALEYSESRNFEEYYARWNTTKRVGSGATFSIVQPIKYTDGTLSLQNKFDWFETSSESVGDTTFQTFSNTLNLSFTQPIFTYNRTKLNLRTLELDLENAQLRYSIDKLTIEKNVTQYFYNVHSAQKALIIAQEELANRQRSYEIMKNKVDAGIAAKEELIQAEIDMTSSQASLYSQQVSVDNAKDQLKINIGMPIAEDILILADISIDSVEVDLQKAVDFALKNRHELRQREIDIQNAYMNLTQQKATNEFRGDVTLSMGLTGDNDNIDNIYSEPQTTPYVGITFEIPLYDWGERKANIRRAEIGIESSEQTIDNERNNIILNIRRIYRNLHNLQLQVKIQEKNIENAQLTYEINLERYKNGDLTSMDLNLFQQQLSQSKIDLTQAIIEYKLELLNLKIESLWDFEKNRPLIENNTTQQQ